MGESKNRAASRNVLTVDQMMKQTSLNESPSKSKPSFLRSSRTTLNGIRHLSVHQNLALFTPAVPQPPGRPVSEPDQLMDPFEPLGRALSKDHRRIRHVPYVPSIGMTDTHIAFLHQSAAVIIVTAEKARATGESIGFPTEMQLALEPLERNLPAMILVISDDSKTADGRYNNFDTVIHTTSYKSSALADVADLIFNT